jgi:hypothetical protein
MQRRGSFPIGPGLLALLAFAVAGVPACATSASFDGAIYRGQGAAFRVPPVPAAWRRIPLPAADLAFRDDAHDASVLINSRCAASDSDTPLVALTAHLVIGTTDRQISREETLPFDGREARHTVMQARLDGVPMSYDIFVLKRDGCVFDFVYVTPPTATTPPAGASGAAEFEAFVHGFHDLPSAG